MASDLSVIIPALNEEEKIPADVRAVSEFLAGAGLAGEVLVVDDGSTDATAEAARAAADDAAIRVAVIQLDRQYGKGAAVKAGMLQSRGRFAMFADSGLCIPFADCLRGMNLIDRGECEIAHGSRFLPGSIHRGSRGPYRRAVGALFRAALPVLSGVPPHLTDTQCGFKVYDGEIARRLYGECRTDGFLFDLEIILRAAAAGCRIAEFPVDWRPDPDSRLHPLRAFPGLLRDFVRLRSAPHDQAP